MADYIIRGTESYAELIVAVQIAQDFANENPDHPSGSVNGIAMTRAGLKTLVYYTDKRNITVRVMK